MSLSCTKCSKVCKDRKGLSLHENKCTGEIREYICTYCNRQYSTGDILKQHYKKCKELLRLQEEEQARTLQEKEDKEKQLVKEIEDFKYRLSTERKDNDIYIKNISKDLEVKSDENKKLNDTIRSYEKKILDLENQVRDMNLERKIVSEKMLSLVEAKSQPTTIVHSNSYTNNINNSHFQLQHFNPNVIIGHIKPPEVVIRSVSQLVDHVLRLGFGNFYRITDRSRKSIVWYDKNGKEIKDSKGSMIAKELVQTLSTELIKQQDYIEQELKRHNNIPEEQRDHYTCLQLHKDLTFTTNLKQCHKSVMKELQEELARRAKSKNDTSIDIPKIRSFNEFITHLQNILAPSVKEWIGLDSKEIGRYLGSKLKDHFHLEGGSQDKSNPYIIVKDDEGRKKIINEEEFINLWKQSVDRLISPFALGLLKHFFMDNIKYNKDTAIKTIEWLEQIGNKEHINTNRYRDILYGFTFCS